MTAVTTTLIILAALALALLLAFLPVRVLVGVMSKRIAAPIRELIQRQRERRATPRSTPDRRQSL